MLWILPFFSNMYIHIDEVSEALHRYLVEKCKKNFSFALQVCMAASYFQHVCVLLLNLFTSVFFLVSLQCSKKAQYSLQRGKSIVLRDVRPCTFGWLVNSLTEPKTVCGSPSLSFTDWWWMLRFLARKQLCKTLFLFSWTIKE